MRSAFGNENKHSIFLRFHRNKHLHARDVLGKTASGGSALEYINVNETYALQIYSSSGVLIMKATLAVVFPFVLALAALSHAEETAASDAIQAMQYCVKLDPILKL